MSQFLAAPAKIPFITTVQAHQSTPATATSETLVTVKGVKSTSGIKLKGLTVTVSEFALNAKKATISVSYEFDFATNYKNATLTGGKNADTIPARGENISINVGSGKDNIKILGSAVTVTSGNDADSLRCGADKYIELVNSYGDVLQHYSPE